MGGTASAGPGADCGTGTGSKRQLWDPGDGQADDEQVRQLEWAAILVEQGKLESA